MEATNQLIFRSAHGDRSLIARRDESIVDVCRRYGLPSTQVSVYRQAEDGTLLLEVQPLVPISDYAAGQILIVVPNRNIDYGALLGGEELVRIRPNASTWIRSRAQDVGSDGAFVTEYLRPSEAIELVAEQVMDAMIAAEIVDEPLVVGVSGGGDSNALLEAIVRSGIVSKANIRPVMMLGIPDWDKGWERAQAMCSALGLSLRTVHDDETARILGFQDPQNDWVSAFERQFPGDDLEVLGVYGVRRILESVAQEVGARRIVIGSNLEDCLSDVLYYICSGTVPFPKPLGRMGRVEILYPLWLTPKALIDGCFPKFSLENYEARYPSQMYGRAYFYYLAQMIVDAYPGAGQDILRGASRLSADKFEEFAIDDELDSPVGAPIPLDVRVKLRRLFGQSAGGRR